MPRCRMDKRDIKGNNKNFDLRGLLLKKGRMQEYAQVFRGSGYRWEAMCIDGTKCVCHIGGRFGRTLKVAVDDIILVDFSRYKDNTADVIYRYTPDEARLLKICGELPENMVIHGYVPVPVDWSDLWY